ncbi:16S rRNA (cytosine(1402)-N(4))-methyltransferase RsmH [Mucisphaera calidilacus]|uniref:Ribosomal RNA small subunit methyltransferase H n=1 Tax=Mucisphaera calidilacus TaxID=2527982 RepID=A0A518BVJ4_9BACT|nr:16S rRNA (cytosine(1402)-N(4))-methyltransferase RsmH [Mucisphaera calidilacus]QDU70996.1 Ribosomal RNA small subunit methyltransferase H [Mucisphaera calidilacus]
MPDSLHGHVPVLLRQTVEALDPQPGETAIDATAGRGGHAEAILERIRPGGRLLLIDRDPGNLAYSRERLAAAARSGDVALEAYHGSFARLGDAMAEHGLDRADVLLADLGFASNQVDQAERGLAFSEDGPLDMRLDPTGGTTAADLVAEASERELADLIYRFGEERLSRRIARKIVEARREQPIIVTKALAELVRDVYGPAAHRSRMHPATRTFMALRIAVNQELTALESLLEQIPGSVAAGGRVGIISFHSLEDRPVKRAFAGWKRENRAALISRKPIEADLAEATANPRSRSAKLRALIWHG